jgi:hypothetical protein
LMIFISALPLGGFEVFEEGFRCHSLAPPPDGQQGKAPQPYRAL